MKLYADRDPIAQGNHYLRHIEAMTAEGLHDKGAIASELAHRDMEIAILRTKLVRAAEARKIARSHLDFPNAVCRKLAEDVLTALGEEVNARSHENAVS